MSKSKTLIIVESPAKAKTIAKYAGDDYSVIASRGHIMDLVTAPGDMGVDIENGFKPKYEIIPDKKDTVKAILDAAARSSEILIASDPDREGEAIAFHIHANLKKITVPIKRVEFKEITKNGVKKGISSPRELDRNLFDAQQARRVLDRIVGFIVSKYLIDSIGSGFSAGRVQSVALRLIVDREREIESFKPEEYWTINAHLAKNKDKLIAKYNNKVTDEKTATKVKNELDKDTFVVEEIVNKEEKKNPFPPLITSTLTVAVSSRYKFPAAKTMKIAQTLYESGMITYMRTDSVRNSPESIQACRDYLTDKKMDIPSKPNTFKSKNNAQDAHEAIRPTDVAKHPDSIYLPEDDKKVYRVIWEYFVASQMNPAVYDTCAVTIKSSSGHILKANGKVLQYKGWLEVMSDVDDDDDFKLPKLSVGDNLDLIPPKIKADKKQTKPPPRWSEKTLIPELERRGIGRPSTYAAIMSKITDRNYVTTNAGVFYATDNGKKVVDKLSEKFHFMQYKYTSEMEEQLDQVGHGKMKYVAVMNDFYSSFKTELRTAYLSESKDYGFKCKACGQQMLLKHGKFGFYLSCADFPICKTTLSCEMVDDKPVIKEFKSPTVDGVQCPKCASPMTKRDGKFGPFYSCSTYPKCNGSAKVPFGKKCSQCGGELYLTIFNEENKLACMQYPACRNVEDVPKEAKVNWVNPESLDKVKMDKTIKKVLRRKIKDESK